MKPLTEPIEGIAWSQVDSNGAPLPTIENIELLLSQYAIVIARGALNADTFAPFYPGRFHANSAENVRDVHLTRLHSLCHLNGMPAKPEQVRRWVQLIGLELEDAERREANEARLRKGGA